MTPAGAAPTEGNQALSDLTLAFQTFSRSSQRLEEAYLLLQERVRKIDRQLFEANQRLKAKVEELDSLTNYLNEVLAALHNGVAACDRQGRITTLNRSAQRMLGVSAQAAVGRPHEEVLAGADGSPSPLAQALATGEGCAGVEREVVTPDGRRLLLNSTVAPIRDCRGELVGAVEIFSDLTEFRSLQERLDRADKLAALGEMAAQLAHEIRNPLNGIEGFASLLLRDLPEGDRRRDFASFILEGARSLNKIVSNMLLFARPSTLHPRPVSLKAVVEEALAYVLLETRGEDGGGVEVERSWDDAADQIVADPDQLRQALMNVFLNAVQAMEGSGRLRVSTRPAGEGRVQVVVHDSGPGIPEGLRQRVLEPFFTTKNTGTGLGLAIVAKILRLHGGDLALECPPEGGTVAILTLARTTPGSEHSEGSR